MRPAPGHREPTPAHMTQSDPEGSTANGDQPAGSLPYGPATAQVRSLLLSLNRITTRDWLVLAHEYRRRSEAGELVKADVALGEVIESAGLGDARDAVVGPVLQIAHRAAAASGGAVQAAGLDAESLAEAALAAVLATLASPVLPGWAVTELSAHLEPHLDD